MKITLTVHQFFPEWQTGTEVLTRDTAKRLIARGHEVEVWTACPEPCPDGALYDFYEHEGIPVHRYYPNRIAESADSDFVCAEYENHRFSDLFARHIRCRRPDIVHAFHLYRLTCSALNVASNAGAVTVYTPTDFWAVCPAVQLLKSDNQLCLGPTHNSLNCVEHLGGIKIPRFAKPLPSKMLQMGAGLLAQCSSKYRDSFCRFRSLLGRIQYQRENLSKIDAILAPTHLMERVFIHNSISRKRVLYQTYGIDTDHFNPQEQKNKSDRFRVGFIGTLIQHKGAHILLQAVKELPSGMPIDVRIYGHQMYYPDYVQYLKSIANNDPRICFCGTFPNHEIGSVFSNMDVLVIPSIWYENTPLVAYSAQATRTPIIASNLGGLSEVISHEVNGLLFSPGDYRSLARAILRLAQDRQLLYRLAQNAISPKSMDQYVSELEMIYEHTLRTRIEN
jgi:glycosyltransferase involved in cell wall biosynthesis